MKAKKFITKAYNGELGLAMCPDWKSLLEKEFPELVKKVEVFKDGDIVEHENGPLVKIKNLRLGDGSGFDIRNVFVTGINWNFDTRPDQWKKASPEEWKSRLIEECKKRGIWDTAHINALEKTLDRHGGWSEGYDESSDMLWSKYGVIYHKGVFATPIKTISLSEAEKQLGVKIDVNK